MFEFVTDRLGAQGTICAGGRYDYLIEQSGGKPAPAVGWALGIERVLDLVAELGELPSVPVPDAYTVIPDADSLPLVFKTVQALRAAGVNVQMNASSAQGMGSMKSQFKRADASGARFALVFGATELASGSVAVKPLRLAAGVTDVADGAGQEQVLQPLHDVSTWSASLKR